ncbi:hypothetical protein VNI00_009987 [Paramarasmius palmivorus]|uniref:Uncharacterized protein n=1 Tax=Paramarasmius palmivorus TaxID=297713 RepID=A0AAW0CKN2_9AGAR
MSVVLDESQLDTNDGTRSKGTSDWLLLLLPEEWLCNKVVHFLISADFCKAKHCFEKARRRNYVVMAGAYILRDEAESKSDNERDRRSTFKDAAKAFRACATLFGRRRSDFLRLSANCSRKAKDFLSAAQAYVEGGMHDDAAECYLELRMYDEAVGDRHVW